MTDMTSYAATPRNPQWVDLSDRHQRARERLREALATFKSGREAKSLNIVGPYGSGKSELMAWGFHYAWTELGIPAIFVNLETLLDCLPEQLGPSKLVQAIDDFLKEQLEGISDNLQNDTRPEGVHLAPDLRYDESFLDYFCDLFRDSDLEPERVQQIIEVGRTVLFLDEIEQKYAYLMERVPSDDRAPLREVVQAVDHGGIPYYLVGSFGLTSAYESVSDADTRREGTVSLPIPDAAELARLGKVADFRNFMWWVSRGRPGWAVKLAQEWGEEMHSVNRMEDFARLEPHTIENLPIVDANALGDLFHDAAQNRVITYLMKLMSPTPLAQIMDDNQDGEELLNQLAQHRFLVTHRQHLVSVDDFCDAVVTDLTGLCESLEEANLNRQLLRYYLDKVLRATADEDDRIVFGGWRDKNEWAAKGGIAPLLILLQDMILEFEGERPDAAAVLSFIDGVFERCQIIGEQVRSHYDVIRSFPKTLQLFIEVYDVSDDTYISLAPKAVESLFPRMVGRPLLTLHRDAKSSIKEQQVSLEASVAASGHFLKARKRFDDIDVIFIFVPAQSTAQKLQEQFFRRQQRDTYMTHDRAYVLLALSEETEGLQLDSETNSDIRILEQIKKLQQQSAGERRLQDFLVSLWHNRLLREGVGGAQDDVFEILDEMIQDPHISKSNRRKLEYYCSRLQQRLDDIARDAARTFRLELKKLFDPESDDFPHKRIDEALVRVKEARAVEQAALAFDVRRVRGKSLEILYGLRQLEVLKQHTKAPHGYGEFLDTYAAVKQARGDIRPALNLEDIANYLKGHNDFALLMTIAGDLGMDPGDDWSEATEGTERAPLLRLFGNMTEGQKVLIRGLSLNSYLKHNQDALLTRVENQALEAEQLRDRLETLQGEIKTFDESLGYDVLSDAEVVQALREVNDLHRMLVAAHDLPPAVLYILYRFSRSGLRELETERQRWSGDDGLEGWRERFREMLNWCEGLKEYEDQLQRAYTTNEKLKTQLIDSKDDLTQEIEKRIEDVVRSTLDKLDKPNKLSDPLPDVDLSDYNEALESTREQVEQIVTQADKVDELAKLLEIVRQQMGDVISNLGAQT